MSANPRASELFSTKQVAPSILSSDFARLGEEAGFDAVALQKYHWIERIDHVHTAGNSSGIVDGASLLTIGSAEIGAELGLEPRARVVATAVTGSDSTVMLTGPAPATYTTLPGPTPAVTAPW